MTKAIHGPVKFIPSGSTILDLALGGGWARGRFGNIVGDKSSGKTLLAIEAFANFKQIEPLGRMRYGEAEAAFDAQYAQLLGFPPEVTTPPEKLRTIEAFHDDLLLFAQGTAKAKVTGPSLYILDSLDALSDDAELERKIDETNTYGTQKAKKVGEMFRRLVQPLEEADCTLLIISQVREDIGITFGDGLTRSGGKALDFYASQIVWMAHVGQIKRTVRGWERAIGVDVKGNVKKNKVALPFRIAEFPIIFGYGIDDEKSLLDWLKEGGKYSTQDFTAAVAELNRLRSIADFSGLKQFSSSLKERVTIEWKLIEKALAPVLKKYGNPVLPLPNVAALPPVSTPTHIAVVPEAQADSPDTIISVRS